MGKQVLSIHVASFSFALYQYSRTHQKAFTRGTGEEDIDIKCQVRKPCNVVETAYHFLAV